jgi:hypothetical protein
MHNVTAEKSIPEVWAIFEILIKLPEGKNSPNLVTLLLSQRHPVRRS